MTAWDFDSNGIVNPDGFEVRRQLLTQDTHLDANDGIRARIEIHAPLKDRLADSVFLQTAATVGESLFNQETKQTLLDGGFPESRARQDTLRLFSNLHWFEGACTGALTLVGSGVSGFTPTDPQPYNQQWNLGIQRELPAAFLLSIAYAGSHSVKLPVGYNPNALQYQYFGAPGDQSQVSYLTALVSNPFYGIIKTGTLAAASVQRQALLAQFPQFTSVGETLSVGNSFYNALQVSAQKRYSHGLTMLLAYTYSKNLGDVNNNVTGFLDAIGTPGYQTNFNRHLEKSVLATDIPQRLVINGNYELPFGKGKALGSKWKPWLHAIAGGWQVNAIGTIQSGSPLPFSVTGAPAFAGSRPNYTGVDSIALTSGSISDRLGGISGGTGYLNAGAFSIPVAFQLGNVPRLTGNIRGPGNRNLDLSLMKTFSIVERLRMQFRAESFNALNQVVFGNPNTSVGSASFGTIASQANSPRIIQIALKVLW
jgi:hypothetical protein